MKKAMNITVAAILFASAVSFAKGPAKNFGNTSDGVVKSIIDIDLDPTFTRKGDKLYINLLNLDQEKVTIKVIDSEGRVVFKETYEGDIVVEKAFNFEKAYEDNYTVIVVDNKKSFKETVAIK